MKYKEYEKVINDLGFEVRYNEGCVSVFDKEGSLVLKISTTKRFSFDNNWFAFYDLPENKQDIVFKNATELASTPKNEREEEKRYRLKVSLPALDRIGTLYLVENEQTKKRILDGTVISDGYKTIFTESELKDIDETGFVREEVTE